MQDDTADSQASIKTPPWPDDVQDLVLFLDHPVFVRLRIEVDGRPFRLHRTEYLVGLHTSLDLSGDGMLSAEEIETALDCPETSPEIQQLLQGRSLWGFDLRPIDGKLSQVEFQWYVESLQGGAFQEFRTAQTTTSDVSVSLGTGTTISPGEVLFTWLDVDRNGRLSPEEIHSGIQSLQRLDFDADGNISLGELDYKRSPFQSQSQLGQQGSAAPVNVIDRSRPLFPVVDHFLSRYGRNDEPGLDVKVVLPEDLAVPRELFDQYDQDENGHLDRRELVRLMESPPVAIELRVRVGERPEETPQVEIIEAADWYGGQVRSSAHGDVNLLTAGTQIEFLASAGSHAVHHDHFQALFQTLDRDGNAYLDREEVRGSLLAGLFDQFDQDHDGLLYLEEMLAFLDRHAAGAHSRTRLVATYLGQDLFEILDVNRDRMIGPRELRQVAERIPLWDLDGDGAISRSEIPRIYQLIVDRGQPEFPGISLPGVSVGSAVASPGAGASLFLPEWFRRMDRNGDGEVSRREFFGTEEQFQQIDVNGDGLISPHEAAGHHDRRAE